MACIIKHIAYLTTSDTRLTFTLPTDNTYLPPSSGHSFLLVDLFCQTSEKQYRCTGKWVYTYCVPHTYTYIILWCFSRSQARCGCFAAIATMRLSPDHFVFNESKRGFPWYSPYHQHLKQKKITIYPFPPARHI